MTGDVEMLLRNDIALLLKLSSERERASGYCSVRLCDWMSLGHGGIEMSGEEGLATGLLALIGIFPASAINTSFGTWWRNCEKI